jgi:hypothetical protein
MSRRIRYDPFISEPYLVMSLVARHVSDFRARARMLTLVKGTHDHLSPVPKPVYADRIQNVVDHLSKWGARTYQFYRSGKVGLTFIKNVDGRVSLKMGHRNSLQLHVFSIKSVLTLKKHMYNIIDKFFIDFISTFGEILALSNATVECDGIITID